MLRAVKKGVFSCVFMLLCAVIFCPAVFATTGYKIGTDSIILENSSYKSGGYIINSDKKTISFEEIAAEVKNANMAQFKTKTEPETIDFENLKVVGSYEIKYDFIAKESVISTGYKKKSTSLTENIHIKPSLTSQCVGDLIVDLKIGAVSYSFSVPSGYKVKVLGTGTDQNTDQNWLYPPDIIVPPQFDNGKQDYNIVDGSEVEKTGFENFNILLNYLRDTVIEAVVAGSSGYGYNVGVAYSEKQRPLNDIMTEVGAVSMEGTDSTKKTNTMGYDFKNLQSVTFTFSSFYSPLFGQMFLAGTTPLPRTDEDWYKYAKEHTFFLESDGKIIIDEGFKTFSKEVSSDILNDRGEKITKTVTISGGVHKFDVPGAKKPDSVISYNMPIAVPYLFEVKGGKGKLMMDALKLIDGYTYSLYNDKIYDEDNKVVTSMGDMRIARDKLYLYKKNVTTEKGNVEKTGVVLLGYFEECVVDTSSEPQIDGVETSTTQKEGLYEQNLYLTGRKIGLDNGYSDALDLNRANSKLMYAVGESGKEGYLPLNTTFPLPTMDLKNLDLYSIWCGQLAVKYPEVTKKVNEIMTPFTKDEMFKYVNQVDMHGSVPSTCQAMRFCIDFGKFETTLPKKPNSDGAQNSETPEGTNSSENTQDIYAFYIIRNNQYVSDESLVNWLKTDTAQSLPYVFATKLLGKITGDFSQELGKLTFENWQQMQKIKNELSANKDMVLVRVLNVVSIIFGVFLIVFAVLFVLFYWVDVFNTFTDISILHAISFGNLYPITDKDTIPYIAGKTGNTKFVTFTDVLIIAAIMVGFSFIFLNVSVFVRIAVEIYQYIMFIMGGAR